MFSLLHKGCMIMKNVRITNMDNGVSIVISKEQFETSKTCLDENTVYEYTDQPISKITIPRQHTNYSHITYIAKILGGLPNEINRTTII